MANNKHRQTIEILQQKFDFRFHGQIGQGSWSKVYKISVISDEDDSMQSKQSGKIKDASNINYKYNYK